MKTLSLQSIQMELVRFVLLFPFWLLGTVLLGGVAVWKLADWLRRQRLRGRQTTTCARGHQVPLFGVYECACGAVHEGRVFGPCPVCHESCGWTPCPECGLPVRNPEI